MGISLFFTSESMTLIEIGRSVKRLEPDDCCDDGRVSVALNTLCFLSCFSASVGFGLNSATTGIDRYFVPLMLL